MQSDCINFHWVYTGYGFASRALQFNRSCAGQILIRPVAPLWVHFEILLPNFGFLIKLQMKRMPEVCQGECQATNKTLSTYTIELWEP